MDSHKHKLPEIPPVLMEALERVFPDKFPYHATKENFEVVRGQQDVMNLLRQNYNRQQERVYVYD